jgi:hypothetical protein
MQISFKVSGVPKLKANMLRINERLPRGLKAAAMEEVQQVMQESQSQVPVVTGTLRDSAFIRQDHMGNITFGYGDSKAAINPNTGESPRKYMIAVHERLDVQHPQGKAKFLEDPVNAFAQTAEQRFTDKLKKFFYYVTGGGI